MAISNAVPIMCFDAGAPPKARLVNAFLGLDGGHADQDVGQPLW